MRLKLIGFLIFVSQSVAAQRLPGKDTSAVKKDTIPPGFSATDPKRYDKVITPKAVSRNGMFTVHKVDDTYLLEIPDSLMGREILMVNRISKSPVNGLADGQSGYYAGDQLNERVITFERGPSHRVFMRSISYFIRSTDSSENGMFRSVRNSSVQPILAAFPVKAYNEKSPATVIDVTELVNTDNALFALSTIDKTKFKAGMFQRDHSLIQSIKTFPKNVEIRTLKTYAAQTEPTGNALTFELNSSLVLLPAVPMVPRVADERVGYFSTSYIDFDGNPQGVTRSNYITRWRLEPRPRDMEKYKRGELVEPQNPIIIYIDPTTPKKWVPYLIQGINDWQAAFEQAGFKNAIMGKEAPVGDSTWSLEDVTHSAVVYKPSSVANASGPHVHDPRTGEILETHINWYHNVMSLVRNWYMIQAGAIDPGARKLEFDTELMGELVRFVSSHEVGHTLGLMHNFGSSSTVPVDSLRSKKFVETYGHTPSIMDYARFNYIAQPEDNIGSKGIYPRINDYDKWAIEWGYRLFPDIKTEKEEKAFLNKWIIDSLSKNHRLWYGPQMIFGVIDPRSQHEDLGNDAIKAGTYGIKNLKRIVTQLPEWTRTPNEGYDDLNTMYSQLVTQFGRYTGHVSALIGGIYLHSRTVEQPGELFEPVSIKRQKQAVAFLNEQIFQTPQWLLNKDIINKSPAGTNTVARLGVSLISDLVMRSSRLRDNTRMFGANNTYPVLEYYNDLKKGIWGELATGKAIEGYRRDLQTTYISALLEIIKIDPEKIPGSSQVELVSLARVHLTSLLNEIRKGLLKQQNVVSRAHLQFNSQRIEDGLSMKRDTK